MIFYSDNDGYIQAALSKATDGSAATGGSVELTSLKNSAGTAAAGQSFPVAMPDTGTTITLAGADGVTRTYAVYRCTLLVPDLTIGGTEIPAGTYTATVEGTVGGLRYHETGTIKIKARKSAA